MPMASGEAPGQASSTRDVQDDVRDEGWTLLGDGRWQREVRQATGIPYPRRGHVLRRVAREKHGGTDIEDLRSQPGTTRRQKHKALKKPLDLVVEIGIRDDEVEPGKAKKLLTGTRGRRCTMQSRHTLTTSALTGQISNSASTRFDVAWPAQPRRIGRR